MNDLGSNDFKERLRSAFNFVYGNDTQAFATTSIEPVWYFRGFRGFRNPSGTRCNYCRTMNQENTSHCKACGAPR